MKQAHLVRFAESDAGDSMSLSWSDAASAERYVVKAKLVDSLPTKRLRELAVAALVGALLQWQAEMKSHATPHE